MRTQKWIGQALILSGLGFVAVACAGTPPKEAASAEKKEDEEKAQRQLEKARESSDPDRYRQILLRFPDTKAAGDARDELAAILIRKAESSLKEQDWRLAENLAEEARQHAGLDMTRKAMAVLDKIDEQRAGEIAEDAGGLAEEGKCASALKQVSSEIRKKPRDHFKAELQKRAQKSLVACLSKKVEEEIANGNLDAARMMLNTPDATTALNNEGYKQANLALQKVVVRKSTKSIEPMLAAHKWQDAIKELGELRKKNELSEEEHEVAFALVQDAILSYLLTVAAEGLTAKAPTDAAQQIATDIKIAKWKNVPEELAKARAKLQLAVECEKLGCKTQAPSNAWAWGAIDIHPTNNAAGEATGKVKHAQKVWVLGKSKEFALISSDDPKGAKGAEVWGAADGWIKTDNLKTTDTDMWLPPVEQLVGVRVWGPLRPPNKEYHLGEVTKVDGNKVSVKRMADGLEASVDLKSLRIGKLPKGLKVMAFCVDELHPELAKVDSVITESGGVPKVKVECTKGNKERVEGAGALTSKAEWLPKRLP